MHYAIRDALASLRSSARVAFPLAGESHHSILPCLSFARDIPGIPVMRVRLRKDNFMVLRVINSTISPA